MTSVRVEVPGGRVRENDAIPSASALSPSANISFQVSGVRRSFRPNRPLSWKSPVAAQDIGIRYV
ncbi:hypothetical protein DVH02_31345 [Streptomyces corynorhini]|uniref:Uncharacterized protein n=1 Tax=Streptomyces corynorhini TaxID=2282652 RepID=A0A370AZC5_9ACTN|nr:hypothetical protein DVH02_31345 [Streptomyces corynorhini]